MDDFLPYGRQWVDDDDVGAVVDVLRSDFLTTGPAVEAFEAGLAEFTGAAHAVAVNSGTSALHAMYFALGLGPGDELITSPLTFAATANAALYLGASVRFVDVEPDTGNIDPSAVEAAISDRTKLIAPVDYSGHPAEYDRLRTIADRYDIALAADAAHSLGATYKRRTVGTLADATELSFHPVKLVTTGEGGAVVTNDEHVAKRARLFRSHGITKDSREFDVRDVGDWWYEQHSLGFNYRLTDMQAALGTSQLRKAAAFVERRRLLSARYSRALSGIQELELPTQRADAESGWHLYVVRTRDQDLREPLFNWLRSRGLGVQVHYLPVHWHPFYRRLGYDPSACPNAVNFYKRAISLPLFPAMTEADQDRVIDEVQAGIGSLL